MEHPHSESIVFAKSAKRARDSTTDDDTNDKQIEKKQKLNTPNTQDPLKLADINNDCLRSIFEYLSVHDLIDVAEANGQFTFAAAEAFSRCHRTKGIEMVATDEAKRCNMLFIRLTGDTSAIALEHFGARMLTIAANLDGYEHSDGEQHIRFDALVVRHCSDSVRTLEIHRCKGMHFQMIDKPFTKVTHLIVNGSVLGEKVCALREWFPNVVRLALFQVNLWRNKSIEAHFDHLTSLQIFNDLRAIHSIPTQTICNVLSLNRQLRLLQLYCDYDNALLVTIAKHLTQLESLELWTPYDRFEGFAGRKVAFVAVKTFILHALPHAQIVYNMPFDLKKVEALKLYGFDQHHPLIADLIKSGEQLRAITLFPFNTRVTMVMLPPYNWHVAMVSLMRWPRAHVDYLKMALRTRNNLVELELLVDEYEDDDLVRFLADCKLLRNVRLNKCIYLPGLDIARFRNDWTIAARHAIQMNFKQLCINRK